MFIFFYKYIVFISSRMDIKNLKHYSYTKTRDWKNKTIKFSITWSNKRRFWFVPKRLSTGHYKNIIYSKKLHVYIIYLINYTYILYIIYILENKMCHFTRLCHFVGLSPTAININEDRELLVLKNIRTYKAYVRLLYISIWRILSE